MSFLVLLPTVATIQASTSHVYFQTNLFRGHVDQLLNGQLILGGETITIKVDFLSGKRIETLNT